MNTTPTIAANSEKTLRRDMAIPFLGRKIVRSAPAALKRQALLPAALSKHASHRSAATDAVDRAATIEGCANAYSNARATNAYSSACTTNSHSRAADPTNPTSGARKGVGRNH